MIASNASHWVLVGVRSDLIIRSDHVCREEHHELEKDINRILINDIDTISLSSFLLRRIAKKYTALKNKTFLLEENHGKKDRK